MKNVKSIKNKFDILQPANRRLRKMPQPEVTRENDPCGAYSTNDRLISIAACRDIERNFPIAKTFLKQIKSYIVGVQGGKMRINSNDASCRKLESVWKKFIKNCDKKWNRHLNELLQLVVVSKFREGDVLIIFDDFINDDGKIICVEADRITAINSAEWNTQTEWGEEVNGLFTPYIQNDGVITDFLGNVVAYSITSKPGLTSASRAESTIIPVEKARMYRADYRLDLFRAPPEILTCAADLKDIYSMRSKELQTAKVASSMAGWVEENDAPLGALFSGAGTSATGGDGIDPEDAIYGVEDGGIAPVAQKNYDHLEELVGGNMDYLSKGEKFNFLDFNRPSVNFREFFKEIVASSGASLGLSKTLAFMSCDGNPVTFRADMAMSHVLFNLERKKLERTILDWLLNKVAEFNGLLNSLPEDWENTVYWYWDSIPSATPKEDAEGKMIAIKGGLATYSTYDPNWTDTFTQLKDQVEFAINSKLPLDIFEMKSGGEQTIDKGITE